jgi:hypothetical protein
MSVVPQAPLQRFSSWVENLQQRWFLHATHIGLLINGFEWKSNENRFIQALVLGFIFFLGRP